jgi:hypothetical protein
MVTLLTGCNQDRSAAGTGAPVPADTVPAIPMQMEVEVFADRLQPAQLVLNAGTPVKLHAENHAQSACTFYVGNYLAGLAVAAGAEQSFTVPNLPGPPSAIGSTTAMGCKEHPQVTGNVIVEPRPED